MWQLHGTIHAFRPWTWWYLALMKLVDWVVLVWVSSIVPTIHLEQSGTKVFSYQDRCWADTTSWILLEGDNTVILQSSVTLADMHSLSTLAIPPSNFSSTFGPTMQLRDLGLCHGSSTINQNSKLTLLKSPEVLRLWIQQLLWIKTLQLARVNARIPTTNTMERGSGLC